MLKYFTLALVVLLVLVYFLGVPMASLRILGFIFVAFAILIFLFAGLFESGHDYLWGGSPWMIKVAAIVLIVGLVLIFIPA